MKGFYKIVIIFLIFFAISVLVTMLSIDYTYDKTESNHIAIENVSIHILENTKQV